jgi:phage shock protein A
MFELLVELLTVDELVSQADLALEQGDIDTAKRLVEQAETLSNRVNRELSMIMQ